MPEIILARGSVKERIERELCACRTTGEVYVHAVHPYLRWVSLQHLCEDPDAHVAIDQRLWRYGITLLETALAQYGPYQSLPAERVWIGVHDAEHGRHFGGFHHHDQGYRYLQHIALTSLVGSLGGHPLDRTLTTLELFRAYAHDTLHAQSYRLYLPCTTSMTYLDEHGPLSFYRFQYGINFRREDGRSYSAKDPVRSTTTRNLGTIMEAASDRFAHGLVRQLACYAGYTPSHSLMTQLIYRDCAGLLDATDMNVLRTWERHGQGEEIQPACVSYFKSMRLFWQYVIERYTHFLQEMAPGQEEVIQEHLMKGMLTGKFRSLCQYLDRVRSTSKSFVDLFKREPY